MSEKWSFPWEREAARGEEMPDGLPLVDQMAYTALRNIYERFHERRTEREQAAREKRLVVREWQRAKDREAFDRRLSYHHVRLIRATERANCVCRKDPSPENALMLCNAIDGLDLGVETGGGLNDGQDGGT